MRHLRIKRRLLQRRHDLLARYHSGLARAGEELESREIEAIENATELWDARVLSMLGDADAHALAEIVAALERLAEGSYGACIECGTAIEPSRLHVLPEAANCFECALDGEKARGRNDRGDRYLTAAHSG